MPIFSQSKSYSGTCKNCGQEVELISNKLGFCLNCLRNDFNNIKDEIEAVHKSTRMEFGLPTRSFQLEKKGEVVKCRMCQNECEIEMGERGFCNLKTAERREKTGRLKLKHLAGTRARGVLDWYHDPLPTNCVGAWCCAGCSRSGYPEFSYSKRAEVGFKNFAVFYRSCTFNCLYCQNYHFKYEKDFRSTVSAEELASCVDKHTSCICYFGGDPTSQIHHSIATSKIALENNKDRILRICWETNGSVNKKVLKNMAKISLESGGCIKIDLKAFNENVHRTLTNFSNKKILENFKYLASLVKERPETPFLIASTLLVPGYIDKEEVKGLSEFIASLNPSIPYSLLGYHPQFFLTDLPTTSKELAYECEDIARRSGLANVNIGNIHLLV